MTTTKHFDTLAPELAASELLRASVLHISIHRMAESYIQSVPRDLVAADRRLTVEFRLTQVAADRELFALHEEVNKYEDLERFLLRSDGLPESGPSVAQTSQISSNHPWRPRLRELADSLQSLITSVQDDLNEARYVAHTQRRIIDGRCHEWEQSGAGFSRLLRLRDVLGRQLGLDSDCQGTCQACTHLWEMTELTAGTTATVALLVYLRSRIVSSAVPRSARASEFEQLRKQAEHSLKARRAARRGEGAMAPAPRLQQTCEI